LPIEFAANQKTPMPPGGWPKLPKAEHEAPEWQAAMEALILVATLRRTDYVARIGVMRALNHGKPDPALTPRRKRAKVYRVIRELCGTNPPARA
jgi:hypothetical protein